jgi:hypothetical protein
MSIPMNKLPVSNAVYNVYAIFSPFRPGIISKGGLYFGVTGEAGSAPTVMPELRP